MKKRLMFCLATLLIVSCALISHTMTVKAETKPGKVPSVIPVVTDDLRAVLDEEFKISDIHFGEEGEITMKKILLTTDSTEGNVLGNNWFSAYCLDSQLKYPQFSILNTKPEFTFEAADAAEAETKVRMLVMFAIANSADETLKGYLKTVQGYKFGPQNVTFATTPNYSDVLTSVKDGNQVELQLTGIEYSETLTSEPVNILAGKEPVTITLDASDLQLDKYEVKDLKDPKYAHALWILEHSYPTLTIEESLRVAGTSSEAVKTELGQDINLDNYMYLVVQYAIWKVTGNTAEGGKPIGDQLVGSVELNKLYQYLISDRDEHNGYLDFNYGANFTMVNPPASSEVREDGDYYVYGPYGVEHNLASIEKIKLSLPNPIEGVSITDASGNVITEMLPEGKFYIRCLKSAKIANVQVKLESVNAVSFTGADGENHRGRIYYAYYPLTQNVVTGGIIHAPEVSKEITLNFNPKTGNENIAAIFVMLLIGCSLAFVGISYKEKPIGLN